MVDTVPCPECKEAQIPLGEKLCLKCVKPGEPAPVNNGVHYRFYTADDIAKIESDARWAGAIAMRKAIVAALNKPLRNGIIDTIEALPVPD